MTDLWLGWMMRISSSGLRPIIPLLTACLLPLMLSCDSSRMASGVFQSELPVSIEGVPGFEQGAWVRLVLAQYGPDVTGIVSAFSEDRFIIPAPDMCHCRYIEGGTVEGLQVSFAFRENGDCPGSAATRFVIASLDYIASTQLLGQEQDDYLEGTLVIEGGDREAAPRVKFRRVRTWDEVGADLLACDDPLVHGELAISSGVAVENR